MVWTRNKKRWRTAGQRHYGMNCTSHKTNTQNIKHKYCEWSLTYMRSFLYRTLKLFRRVASLRNIRAPSKTKTMLGSTVIGVMNRQWFIRPGHCYWIQIVLVFFG
jgi:hypothetical protein